VVAFDAVGPAGGAGTAFTTGPGTWTHVNTGNGILVACTVFTGSTDTVTAATYGGVSLSKIGFTNTGAAAGGISYWGLAGPTCPTGSNTVSVTASDTNNHNAGSVSFSASGSFGTLFTANSGGAGTTSQAVTVNGTTTGGLIVTFACHGANGGTWGLTGGTVRVTHDTGSSSGSDNIGGGTAPSTGGGANQTLTWTNTISDEWGIVAVEVLPPAVAAPAESYPVRRPPGRRSPMALRKVTAQPDPIPVFSTRVSAAIAASTAGAGIQVAVVTGQAASFLGNIASAALPTGSLIQVGITTTVTGSLVFVTGGHNNSAGSPPTAIAGCTNIGSFLDSTNGCDDWAMRTTAATGTPGAITVGETATNLRGAIAAMEVLAGTGLVIDGSTPAYAGVTTAGPAISPIFTPPPGALLVALVYAEGLGTSASQTTTVTDTGGLTWTKQVEQSGTTINGVAAIWTAVVPGGAGPVAVGLADAAGAAEASVVSAAVPVADTAAAADQVAVSAAVPAADVAAATDALAVSVTVPLAEQGAAADQVAVSAVVALPEVAAAADQEAVNATIPLADAAGAADAISVVISSAIAQADAAGATEAVSVTAAVLAADAAGAVDALSVAVSAPLAETAGASDALTIAATVNLPDVAGATESQVIGTRQADAAGATDALAVTVTLPLADAAGAIESQAIGLSYAEAAASAESVTVAVSTSTSDAAGAAEAVSVSSAVPLTDAAAAADAISVTVGQPVSFADAAGARDAVAVTAAGAVADTAGASEQLAVTASTSLAEAAGATDAISVTVGGQAVSLADAAGAADQLTAAVTAQPADAAAAADALAVSATSPQTDRGGAADSLGVTAGLSVADQAGAVDTLSVTVGQAVAQADFAAARDALSVVVSVPLTERAAAADVITLTAAVALTEAASAADRIEAVSSEARTGTVAWAAYGEPARWLAVLERQRWEASTGSARWNAEPGQARWDTEPEQARWEATLQTFSPISSTSPEYVNIRWTSDLDGTSIDPTITPLTCQYALSVSSGDIAHPAAASTWYTGAWLIGGTGKGYVEQCIVGPGTSGPVLARGQYDVWGQVQGTPEAPRKFVGVLTVY
jgi:hypothetical protein